MPTLPGSGETSLRGLQVAPSHRAFPLSLPLIKPPILSNYDPTSMTLFNLNYLLKVPSPIQTYWKLRLQHMNRCR